MDVHVGEVVRPGALSEALAVLARRPEAKAVAGGTDLMVQLRDGRRRVGTLVDLGRLGLDRIVETDRGIEVGAATCMDRIAAEPRIRTFFPALAAAAAQVGAWPIQCRATIGGNLANASPAADTAPPLFIEGARVKAASNSGERSIPIEEFFLAPGRSALAPSELIVSVFLPYPEPDPGARLVERFVKVGPRPEQIISVVSLAARAMVLRNGALSEVRVALGSVAPTPVRGLHAERTLEGRVPDAGVRREAARALQEDIAPIDDVRAPARYRRLAAAVLLDRFLEEAAHA